MVVKSLRKFTNLLSTPQKAKKYKKKNSKTMLKKISLFL